MRGPNRIEAGQVIRFSDLEDTDSLTRNPSAQVPSQDSRPED